MNLPNKLTMARVIMIPFFVIFMLTENLWIRWQISCWCVLQ